MNAGEKLQKQMIKQDILVVDADARTAELVCRGLGKAGLECRSVRTTDEALLELRQRPANVMMVNLELADNQGPALIDRVAKTFPLVEPVAITRSCRFELAVEALRAGVRDMVALPVNSHALEDCVKKALERAARREQNARRNLRLRRVCKQLNKARHEISQQVDLLCKDLVSAYRELADRMYEETPAAPSEYAAAITEDFDAESLLRKTMEHLLKTLGPVNAAAFLPNSEGEFSLGAYLNYDTPSNSVLVDVLSQTLVRKAAESEAILNLPTDDTITQAAGPDQSLLDGRHWMLFGLFDGGECFGVLVVFRNQDEPLEEKVQTALKEIGPILGHQIARLLAIHHRGNHLSEDLGDGSEPS